MTVREPEYDDDDVAALLAARRDRAVARNAAGIPLTEARDPENQFAYDAKPVKDWALGAVKAAQDRYFADNKDAKHDPSIGWIVTRRGGTSKQR